MKARRISSILEEASKIKSKKEREAFVVQHKNNPLLKAVVQYAYHPNVEWLLPEGQPVYKKNKDTYESDIVFYQEFNKLYLFVKGGNNSLQPYQRAKLFVNLLEKLHPEDAELLLAMKDKNINYPFMTEKLFRALAPEWFN